MPWLNHVPAVIEAWYPGQRGGEAIAAVLTGAENPSGRLPITFPAAAAQAPRPAPVGLDLLHARDAGKDPKVPLPMFTVDYPEGANVGYRWYQKTGATPLFPFGYGLSYTSFRYAGLRVSGGEARFTITNTGARAGSDVAQVYVGATDEDGVATDRLAGWARVSLAPGETRAVSVTLDPRVAARWDAQGHRWSVPRTPLPLVVGRSATDPVLTGTVLLPAGNALEP
jgi:beta-glucosidase